MTFPKLAAVGAIALMATAVSSAQQKFPMQSGEWAVTLTVAAPNGKPAVLLYCLNDETWDKALIHNPACSTQKLSITSSGASYVMDCQHGSSRQRAPLVLPLTESSTWSPRIPSTPSPTVKPPIEEYSADYRWKGPSCDPNADMNLKFNKQH